MCTRPAATAHMLRPLPRQAPKQHAAHETHLDGCQQDPAWQAGQCPQSICESLGVNQDQALCRIRVLQGELQSPRTPKRHASHCHRAPYLHQTTCEQVNVISSAMATASALQQPAVCGGRVYEVHRMLYASLDGGMSQACTSAQTGRSRHWNNTVNKVANRASNVHWLAACLLLPELVEVLNLLRRTQHCVGVGGEASLCKKAVAQSVTVLARRHCCHANLTCEAPAHNVHRPGLHTRLSQQRQQAPVLQDGAVEAALPAIVSSEPWPCSGGSMSRALECQQTLHDWHHSFCRRSGEQPRLICACTCAPGHQEHWETGCPCSHHGERLHRNKQAKHNR